MLVNMIRYMSKKVNKKILKMKIFKKKRKLKYVSRSLYGLLLIILFLKFVLRNC